jgi:hypothetical protein
MVEQFRLDLRDATESSATLDISFSGSPQARDFKASLCGPQCAYARTLTTEFNASASGESNWQFLVSEPCYWTPQLPFLYELHCQWRDSSNQQHELNRQIGLRRLTARRDSLYWDGKRIVLRGLTVAKLKTDMISDARQAEVALIVTGLNEEQCDLADKHGVPLVADLRGADESVENLLFLASHASVLMLLVDGSQELPCERLQFPSGTLLAVASNPKDDPTTSAARPPAWANLIAVELAPGMQPPAWMANPAKPVIAIRSEPLYADFFLARAACDQLQAALAPDFDLAGYFV